MASSTEDVKVKLALEKDKQFRQGMNSSGKSVRGFGKDVDKSSRYVRSASVGNRRFRAGILNVGSAASTAAFVGIGALATGVFKATQGWSEHLAVTRRTSAVIKSTGGAANVSAKHVGKLSDSLERQTGVDGDLIQSGANLLLTFTNVRNGVGKNNKIFDQASGTVVNMSKALGQDTKSSAIQLGKALNDPVKGITALSRVGVSFTDQQKEQIKTLVESGDTMKAQKIILGELGKEFPKVKATPFERLQVTLRSLQDTVGKFVLPLFNKAVTAINKFIAGAQNGTGAGGKFVDILVAIGNGFKNYVIEPLKTTAEWIAKNNVYFQALGVGLGVLGAIILATYVPAWTAAAVATITALAPVIAVGAAIVAVGAALFLAYKKCKVFRNIVNGVASFLVGAGKVAFEVFKFAVKAAWEIFKRTPAGFVLTHLKQVINFVKGMPGKISSAASGMWDGLKNAFKGAINWILSKWNDLHFSIGGTDLGPFGHLPKASLDTPNIPLLAQGGNITRAGSAIVGDRGPELIHLNRGAQVEPLSGGGAFDVNVYIGDRHIDDAVVRVTKRKMQRS